MGGWQGHSAQTDSLANAVGHHSLVQRSLEVGPTEDVEMRTAHFLEKHTVGAFPLPIRLWVWGEP